MNDTSLFAAFAILGLTSCGRTAGLSPHLSPSELSSLCRFDTAVSQARISLAVVRDTDIVLIRNDGTHFVAHSFGTPPTVVSSGRYFAASAPTPGANKDPVYDVVLLDDAGNRRWLGQSGLGVDHRGGNSVLNENGQLALSIPGGSFSGHDLLLVEPDGTSRRVQGYLPMGRPLADGTVSVCESHRTGELFTNSFGWWTKRGFVPLTFPPAPNLATSYPSQFEDRLLYTGMSNNEIVLISERPGDVKTFALPNASFGFVGWHADSPWQMLHSSAGTPTAWLLNISTGLTQLSSTVFAPWPSTDETGGVLRLRSESSRAIWERSTDNGQTFSAIGKTMGAFQSSSITDRGGTYVITTSAYVGPFERAVEWDSAGPAPQLRGESWQVARPTSGKDYSNNSHLVSLTLSADGQCAAYWHAVGDRLSLETLDVESGQVFEFFTGSTASKNIAAPAWISDEKR